MPRLPPWLRTPLRTDRAYGAVHALAAELQLGTVCRSARCPNRHECWNDGTATFLALGPVCTRGCRFCSVPTGTPCAPDPEEPARLGSAVRRLGLRYAVLTMVTRDDLPDGGAAHMAACIQALRGSSPGIGIEVLTSDFAGDPDALSIVLEARPDVFAHNVETVPRLQGPVRRRATYEKSLDVLRRAAGRSAAPVVKSGLMLGMGETDEERVAVLRDLRACGCRLLTLGQYMAPGTDYWPVAEYVTPERFQAYAEQADALGFEGVASGPLVRSSYRAGELLEKALARAKEKSA